MLPPADHRGHAVGASGRHDAWRRAIPYGAGTWTASRAQIEGAARQIYAEIPEILQAVGLG